MSVPSSKRHLPDGGRGSRSHRAGVSLAALLCTVALGCVDEGPERASEPAASGASSALVGIDGNLTVGALNTVVNQYAVLAANVTVGATSVSVTNAANLTSASFGPLDAGDLVLVIQMQGATIDTTDTASYGAVTSYGSAGNYELIAVAGVSGNTIALDPASGGLKNDYTTAGHTQVVRIPQLVDLTVGAGASIVAPAWNGSTGGIVAIHATGTVSLAATAAIDVSGRGFRGGQLDHDSLVGQNVTIYRSTNPWSGAEKGESIAGSQTDYDATGRYGRGAPANGGGGGNSHNSGGGGGANAASSAVTYSGAGVMRVTANAPLAGWQLDPAYIANQNALTVSPGGGRGGYTYSANDADALVTGPGDVAWGGDRRREVGGLGGRPLAASAAGRLFFGGGGGAGDQNNGAGGAGGAGGGLVFVVADSVTGTGSIRANGANGESTGEYGGDGSGGGGGGGTVVVRATTLNGVTVQANGGAGGNQTIMGNEAEGPGGGGGGGFVATGGGAIPVSANGGAAGSTDSVGVDEFVANGATDGNTGVPDASAATLVGFIGGTLPDTSISAFPPIHASSTVATFQFTSNEPNATFECSLDGGATTSCTTPFTYEGRAEGTHVLHVFARDSWRNVDPTPASYTWMIDVTAPETQITSSPGNPSNSAAASFELTSDDDTATFECSLDVAPFAACSSPHTLTDLTDGSHTLEVRAVDPVGNVDPTPATFTFTVDTAAPIPMTDGGIADMGGGGGCGCRTARSSDGHGALPAALGLFVAAAAFARSRRRRARATIPRVTR